MEIIFAGICCWIDSTSANGGKTVVAPNVMAGGRHNGNLIPSHQGFIHVKRYEVDSDDWGHGWFGGDDNLYCWLTGDRLSFSPGPIEGPSDLNLLPHVLKQADGDAICPAAEEIRPGFLHQPTAANVIATAEFPANASLQAVPYQLGAIVVKATIPEAPVRITATPLPGSDNVVRSLVVTDSQARVIVANVNLGDYITGIPADENDHKYLVCGMFRPKIALAGRPDKPEDNRMIARAADVSVSASLRAAELDTITQEALRSAANRAMSTFLNALAAGCSSSQWP